VTVTITAVYRAAAGAGFDFERYAAHLDLVRERWGDFGLVRAEAYQGIGALGGGEPPVVAIALLHFVTLEAAGAALAGEHFGEVAADIANFTSIVPELQLNAPIGE
jgi:uncharacterized protein (TIGR02118 family)